MSRIRIISAIILFILLFSRTLFAACYDMDNLFDNDGNIGGLKISFFNNNNCSEDYKKSSPYKIFVSKNSSIKNSNEIKFRIPNSDLAINEDQDIIVFYSRIGLIARVYVGGGEVKISPASASITKNGETYSISNIEFRNISKLTFGSKSFVGIIDNIRYRTNNTDFIPLIAIKSYRIYTEEKFSSEQVRVKSLPPKLRDGVAVKSVIYYDHKKDYNNKGILECKSGYEKTNDLGYYFEQTGFKLIKFTGCCFREQYDSGFMDGNLKTTENIDYDSSIVGESDITPRASNDIVCQIGRITPGSNLSYYFDTDRCSLALTGSCTGDGEIPNSPLINQCSTMQVGDVVLNSAGTNSNKVIACKIGCTNDQNLFYNLSAQDASVVISGTACREKSKTLRNWASNSGLSVPKGLNGNQFITYLHNGSSSLGAVNCIPGYHDNSITYYFPENTENIVFDGFCTAKKYRLDSYDSWSRIDGLNGAIEVDYDENRTVLSPGLLDCSVGFSRSNLGYYFTDRNDDGEPDIVIVGNCIENTCPGNLVNTVRPINTKARTQLLTVYSRDSNLEFQCDDTAGYVLYDTTIPKINCQDSGDWLASGSCRLHQCQTDNLISDISTLDELNQNYDFGPSSYNFDHEFDLSCNNSIGYVNDGTDPSIKCTLDGWDLDNTCQMHQCLASELLSKISKFNKINQNNNFGPETSYNFDHQIDLSCDSSSGYINDGTDPSIKCTLDGWELNDTCELNQCLASELSSEISKFNKINQNNDFGSATSYNFDHKFDLSCDSSSGYVNNGTDPSIRCIIGGWQLDDTCQIHQCLVDDAESLIATSTKLNQNNDFGSAASYNFNRQFELSCNDSIGYVSNGTEPFVECRIDGWMLSNNCTIYRCSGSSLSTAISSSNGMYSSFSPSGNYNYNHSFNLGCQATNNYFNNGSNPSAQCKIGGWQISDPCKRMCKAGAYNVQQEPQNLKSNLPTNLSNRDIGHEIRYNSHDTAYVKNSEPNPYVKCEATGRWKFYGSDNCVLDLEYCNSVPTNLNANVSNITDLSLGIEHNISCDTGYSGSITLTCKSDKSWDIAGSCIKQCHKDAAQEIGNIGRSVLNIPTSPTYYNKNSQISYNSCQNGYIKNSGVTSPYLKCENDGGWGSYGADNCILDQNHCASPPGNLNIDISDVGSGFINQTLNRSCNIGYSGSITLTCKSDKSWDIAGSCIKQCHKDATQEIGNIGRSVLNIPTSPTYYNKNSQISYNSCQNGYIKNSGVTSPYLKCENDGGWGSYGADNCILDDAYCNAKTNKSQC